MKKFILNLISSDNATSSKRVAGLTIVITTISLAITATVKSKGICPEPMFDSLLVFAGGCFGLNCMENIFKKKDSTPVNDDSDTPPVDNNAGNS